MFEVRVCARHTYIYYSKLERLLLFYSYLQGLANSDPRSRIFWLGGPKYRKFGVQKTIFSFCSRRGPKCKFITNFYCWPWKIVKQMPNTEMALLGPKIGYFFASIGPKFWKFRASKAIDFFAGGQLFRANHWKICCGFPDLEVRTVEFWAAN